jgi:nonsense-mediated mRNA decay protein 3
MECYLKDKQPGLKDIEVPCCSCGRIRVGGEWLKDPWKKLGELVGRNVVLPEKIKPHNISVKTSDAEKNIQADVRVEGTYEGQKVGLKFTAEVKKKPENCTTCSRISGNYYEAILQYRGKGTLDLDPEEVSGEKKVQGGVDYQIVSLRYARSVASRLKKKGYTSGESYKIHGRKDGKNVFRTTVLLRPPPFTAGEIIERAGDAYLVTKVGENTETFNLSLARPDAIHQKTLGEFKRIGDLAHVHNAVVTAVTPSDAQVMDLKNYKTHTIPKVDYLKHGDEVKIFVHNHKCLLVPKHLT